MSLYNPSEFLQLLKEDAEIDDIPLIVTDDKIWDRICRSALKDFSQLHPYIKNIIIGDGDRVDNHQTYSQFGYITTYKIEYHHYYPLTLIGINSCMPRKMDMYADFYIPQGLYLPVDDMITLMADTQLTGTIGSCTGRAPTGRFRKPDLVDVFNGYGGAYYDVELKLTHDTSLSTIPDSAFIHFRELALYDMETYLYGKYKRKSNVNTGNGNMDLKIDEWANAKDKYKDLIKEWSISANIDYDNINYW